MISFLQKEAKKAKRGRWVFASLAIFCAVLPALLGGSLDARYYMARRLVAATASGYDTDAAALFDLVEGTDGATYVAGAKDAIDTMIAGIKADGNWTAIEDLWFTPGIDLTTSGGTATLAALGRTIKGNMVTLSISAAKLHRAYTPTGAGCGIMGIGKIQESSPDSHIILADFGFTGVNGFFGMLGWTGEQDNYGPIYGITSGAAQANTELIYYDDDSISSRVRMHGSATEHKAYGSGVGLQAGWLGGFRNGTLLNNLRDNTVVATVNSGGAADASTAVQFYLNTRVAASGYLTNMIAFLSAPGASDAQRQSIQARINTAAQALGAPSSSTGATIVQCYGDSLMMGSATHNARPWTEFIREESGFDAWWQNMGRSGAESDTTVPPSTWRTSYGQFIDPDGSYFSGKVCFLLIGTNDLGNATSTPAEVWANIQSFCSTMQTAGYSVVVMTVPPRDDTSWDSTKETNRGTLNTSIRGGEGTDYDVLFDLDDWIANTLGGSGITPSNTTYYQADKLHFTDALYEAMAAAIAADASIAALF